MEINKKSAGERRLFIYPNRTWWHSSEPRPYRRDSEHYTQQEVKLSIKALLAFLPTFARPVGRQTRPPKIDRSTAISYSPIINHSTMACTQLLLTDYCWPLTISLGYTALKVGDS